MCPLTRRVLFASCTLLALLAEPAAAVTVVPETAGVRTAPAVSHVLVVSVDALRTTAMRQLGRGGAPNLWRLVDQGAATLNARSAVERTETLPNHTSMVTGRRIDPRRGGHGVTWNDDRSDTTVQEAAGEPVGSVFSVVHAAGRETAVFSTKTKLSLFDRSWPAGVGRSTILEQRDGALVYRARRDLVRNHRALTFLHLGGPDAAGRAAGYRSATYRDALVRVDRLVGRLVATLEQTASLAGTVVVLAADHGAGRGTSHYDPTQLANSRVPFVVWGRGIGPADLYAINPDYADPGTGLPGYDGPQPIRNGDVANLVTDLLGLGPVPGSELNADQRLRVSR